MAWDTADKIDKVVDEVISLLETNAATLGGLLGVLEKDEEPAVPAANHMLPWAYVIPTMEGGDHMVNYADTESVMHEYPITVVGYYEMPDTDQTSIRAVRRYGYTAYDILRQHDYTVIGPFAGLTEADLDVGYWVAVDAVVHFFILRCTFKSLF
jgi:hypothetical protein